MSFFKNLKRNLFRQSVDNSVIIDSTVIQVGGNVNYNEPDTARTLATLSDQKLLNKYFGRKCICINRHSSP